MIYPVVLVLNDFTNDNECVLFFLSVWRLILCSVRFLTENGDHYLRKANQSVQLIDSDISHNHWEAIFVNSPFWDIHKSNLTEATFTINNTLITDNGFGIRQFSRYDLNPFILQLFRIHALFMFVDFFRDMRSSNNLFHWELFDNTIERNQAGGFDVALPYAWEYNENYTHSFKLNNNTWRNNKNFAFVIDGHFAALNLTNNIFEQNHCKSGLISIQGMEKRMKIQR